MLSFVGHDDPDMGFLFCLQFGDISSHAPSHKLYHEFRGGDEKRLARSIRFSRLCQLNSKVSKATYVEASSNGVQLSLFSQNTEGHHREDLMTRVRIVMSISPKSCRA